MTRVRLCIFLGMSLLVASALLTACQEPVAPTKEAARPTPVLETASPAQTGIQAAWQGSGHSKTFVEGENNTCARCHSPMTWTPTDPADMPPTCASCKFTIKTPKPVQQADWQAVTCEVCHKVANGALTSEVVWLNAAIAQFDSSQTPYEAVATSSDLCRKCHADVGGLHYGRDLGTGAHSSFTCTKCHNAHSTKANCADCHQSLKAVAGHDKEHAAVNCVACHDASALKVGPTQDKKTWLTFKPTDPRGKPGDTPYVSHNLQRQVDCARCHYAGNPWNLETKAS